VTGEQLAAACDKLQLELDLLRVGRDHEGILIRLDDDLEDELGAELDDANEREAQERG